MILCDHCSRSFDVRITALTRINGISIGCASCNINAARIIMDYVAICDRRAKS